VGATPAFFVEPYAFDVICEQPPPSGMAHWLRVVRAGIDTVVSIAIMVTYWSSVPREALSVLFDEGEQPGSIFHAVSILQIIRLFLRFVNTLGSQRHGNDLKGGVAMLIIMEICLEFGQGIILAFAFVFESFFVEKVRKWVKSKRVAGIETPLLQVEWNTTFVSLAQLTQQLNDMARSHDLSHDTPGSPSPFARTSPTTSPASTQSFSIAMELSERSRSEDSRRI